jgi:hypothetical protein
VVETEHGEAPHRPPHAHGTGHEIPTSQTEIGSETHEPVAADSADEDLVPFGNNLLSVDDALNQLYRCRIREQAAIWKQRDQLALLQGDESRRTRRRRQLTTKNNRHNKKTAGKVTPEADEPMYQHLVPGDTALKTSHTSQLLDMKLASEKQRNLASSTSTHKITYHGRTSKQVGTAHKDHNQGGREENVAESLDETRSVLGHPGIITGDKGGTSGEGCYTAGRHGRAKDLGGEHVGLEGAQTADDFDRLDRAVGVAIANPDGILLILNARHFGGLIIGSQA